jgi:RND family efflux transporter MFP subunit
MNRSVVVAITLLTVVGLAAAGCRSPAAEAKPEDTPPPAIDVSVVTVSMESIESGLEVSGTLAPRSRVPVKPRLPGTLERVLVDIGDRVKEGQVIATVDRREIDAQADAAAAAVAVAKAALENAEATMANADLERERAQTLFDKGALPRQRLDTAETARRSAAAQRDLAQASLTQAEATSRRMREVQRDATITAPVTGFIVERNYDAGATPGDLPVVVVADLRQMKLEAGVSELEAGRLRVGMKARVSVQAKPGETFQGELAAIAPEVDDRNRHFRIDVRVPNESTALLSGMYATVRIIDGTAKDAVVVPREALATVDGKRTVFKVDGETINPVAVTEGISDGARVQVVSGLAAGDRVMADARRALPAGTRVRAVEAK